MADLYDLYRGNEPFAPGDYPALRTGAQDQEQEINRLRERAAALESALRDVVRIADRETVEFIHARTLLATGRDLPRLRDFPTALMRATIYGSFGLANGVLEEMDFDGNWHEVAWAEDDEPPTVVLARLLAEYGQPVATTSPAAGAAAREEEG